MQRSLLSGHLDGLLLAVISQGPGHGYELSRRLAQRSGGELTIPEGSLYPALHRLERSGFITSSWGAADGRRRRIYRVTRAGRRAAKESRAEWQVFAGAVNRVMGAAT